MNSNGCLLKNISLLDFNTDLTLTDTVASMDKQGSFRNGVNEILQHEEIMKWGFGN